MHFCLYVDQITLTLKDRLKIVSKIYRNYYVTGVAQQAQLQPLFYRALRFGILYF